MFLPEDIIREKKHRLPPERYRGRVIVAFTICADNAATLLTKPEHFSLAIAALNEAFTNQHGHVGVFVFMPDHLHLSVSGSGPGSDLLKLVAEFKQKTCFRIRKAGGSFAWQKDFYDRIIRDHEEYVHQVRYILRNPVRAGLVPHWEHWLHRGVLGQTWQDLALNIASL